MHNETSTNGSKDRTRPVRKIGKGIIGTGLVVSLLLVPFAAHASSSTDEDAVTMTCIELGTYETTLYGLYSWTWKTSVIPGLEGQATQVASLIQCGHDGVACTSELGQDLTVGHFRVERRNITVSDEQSRLEAIVAPLKMEWPYTCKDGHLMHAKAYEAATRFHDFSGCANGEVLEQPISGHLAIDTQRPVSDVDELFLQSPHVSDPVKLHGHRLSLDPQNGCEDVNGVYAPRLDGVGPRAHIM